jgi:hypothetical protein
MIVWKTPEVIEEVVGAALKYLINKRFIALTFLKGKGDCIRYRCQFLILPPCCTTSLREFFLVSYSPRTG